MSKLFPVSKLSAQDQELVKLSLEVRERAYAPYSNFLVGCALRDSTGEVFVGCNVENASYGATNCAERSAIFTMVSQGKREIESMALVTSSKDPAFPCGMCLQVIQELGRKARIIALDNTGKYYLESTLEKLFPSAFSVESLDQ